MIDLPPQPSRRPRPEAWLAIAVILSLALNAVMAVRSNEHARRADRAEAEVAELERRLAALGAGDDAPTTDGPFAPLRKAVERLRGLRFREPVEPRLLNRAALAAEIEEAFADDADAEAMRASGRVLAAFGLLDREDDLYEIVKDATTSQVVGFYDDRSGDLVALAEDARAPSPFTRVALVHELTHAVTHQHFDTSELEELEEAREDDAAYAYLSLLEGDATWVMNEYARSVLTPEEQAAYAAEGLGFAEGATVPGFLESVFAFPYVEGAEFVSAIRERGGPRLLDAAYRDPPASTEQILHPAKYLDDRDVPRPVEVADVARALGRGWREIDAGTFGELDVRMVLDGDETHAFLPTAQARDAAAGWDGGAYRAAVSGGRIVVGVVTVWDSTGEASGFARAVGRWLPERFGRSGAAFGIDGQDGRGWDAGAAGAGGVVRKGDRVAVVVGDGRADVVRALNAID